MRKLYYLLILLLPQGLLAQNELLPGCGSDVMRDKLFGDNPLLKQKQEQVDAIIRNEIINKNANFTKYKNDQTFATLYTVPVVVHVMHLPGTAVGSAENISDAQVNQAIVDLNESFRNNGNYYKSYGQDIEIEFCLATKDPSNNNTNGITRTATTMSNLDMNTNDLNLKNLDRWDPTKYMNIWVVKDICAGTNCGVAGYAYLASAHGMNVDGIVCEAAYFGSSRNNSKVHIHEVGHYFNLSHTFDGGCTNNNCLTDGDKVCDTPPDNSTTAVSCSSTTNTCTTDDDDLSSNNPFRPVGNGGLGDQNDMFQNYMDYGYQNCQDRFTPGQKERMRIALTGVRASLTTSNKCSISGSAPTANFSFTPSSICAGNSVSFSDISTGSPTSWSWTFQGGNPSSSTSQNPSVVFSTAGTYSVTLTATNANGNNSKTINITVNTKPSISISSSAGSSVCNGSSTTLSASGASTYSWLPATYLNITTGTSVISTPSSNITYTITGTNANGCANTSTYTLAVLSTPTISISGSNSICQGSSTSLSAGGAATYSWAPSTGLSSSTGSSVTATPSVSTTYTVTGTASNGCVNTSIKALTVNSLPSVSISPASNNICPGGSTTLNASGANTYSWSPANGLNTTSGSTVIASPSTNTSYTVTGIDNNGCSKTASASVALLTPPTITVTSSKSICAGTSTGLNASGASAYSWAPSMGLNTTSGASVTASPTITTTYTVTGTATNGCSSTATVTITITSAPTLQLSSNTSICTGSSTPLIVSGANSYTWAPATGLNTTSGSSVIASPTATITYTVTGNNGCTSTASVTVTVNPLPTVSISPVSASVCPGNSVTLTASGTSTSYSWSPSTGLNTTTGANVMASSATNTTYSVTGTDANGCSKNASVIVTLKTLPVISVSASKTICGGTSTSISASGGSTYNWAPSTGLSSSSGSTVTANPTVTTTYTVTGTSTNGCSNTASTTITVSSAPQLQVSAPPIICSGTSAQLTVSGANTYTWSPSTGLNTTSGNTVTASPSATTTYTVTGNNGCTSTASIKVTVNALPTLSVTPTSSSICYGATTTLTASGTSTSYNWSPSNGLNTTSSASVIASPTITTTYTVIGTNVAGCSKTLTSLVTIKPLPVITTTKDTSFCAGSSVTLSASGAYSYSWLPSTGLNYYNKPSVIAKPLSSTTYTVTGTASNGCKSSKTIAVTVKSVPVLSLPASQSVCAGTPAVLQVGGADSYYWSPSTGLNTNSGNTVIATPTVTTTYSITGTLANGCSKNGAVLLTIKPLPTLAVSPLNPSICEGSSITMSASGASTYLWSPATGLNKTTGYSVLATPSSTTTYSITGTSTNGCIKTISNTITVKPLPALTVTPSVAICSGQSTLLTAAGASTYLWSPTTGLNSSSLATVTAKPTATTTYSVKGTGTNGCFKVASVTVTVNPVPRVLTSPTSATVCSGTPKTLTASGANSYSWFPATFLDDPTKATVICTPTATTTYTISGNNTYGCSSSVTLKVTVNPLPNLTVSPDVTITKGASTTLTASGAYSYLWSPSTGLNYTTKASVIAKPTVTTSYKVKGTLSTGCYAEKTVTVTVLPEFYQPAAMRLPEEDIKQPILLHSAGSVIIYPNPTRDKVNISLSHINDQSQAEINIMNTQGQVVLNINKNGLDSGAVIESDVSQLAKGIYFVIINLNGESHSTKLVVE